MANFFSEIFRKYLGWCPMAAAARQVQGGLETAAELEKATGSGPVARRAVLFSQLTWAVVGLAWIVAFVALPYLPDTIPVHWNIYGEADAFSGRLAGAFGLPAIMTLTTILIVVLPRFKRIQVTFDDPRDIYAIVTFGVVSLMFGIEVTTLLSSAGVDLPVAVVFPLLLGFFFIVVGSLMPYIRRNTIIGFRLPWTVRSETVWNETHRHGGQVFVITGVLIVLVSTIGGKPATPLAFGILAVAIVYTTAWSYRLSRTVTEDQIPAKDH